MTSMIKNHFGETISQKKILRLMQENDVLSVVRRKRYKQDVYEKMKETLKNIPKNLLQRDFSAPEPNKVYVTDITYLYGRERIDYLSIIVDLYNKEIVAWQISKHPDKGIFVECFDLFGGISGNKDTVIAQKGDMGSFSASFNCLLEFKSQ